MNKDFIVNLAFLVAINLIVKPVYIFGIDVGVQNQTGNDYGLYFAILNFTYLFLIFADFGIQQYNNRTVAQDNKLIYQLFPDLLTAKLVLSIPFVGLVLVFGWIIGFIEHLNILGFVLFNQLLVSLLMFLRSNISGLGMYRKDSILSIADKLFMIVFCGYLLIQAKSGRPFVIMDFLLTQTVSFVFAILLAMWFLKGHRLLADVKSRWSQILPILKQTWPFGLAVFLMTLYTRIDGVMIERLIPNGDFEATVYAGGYRILDAANMFAFLFPPLLLPMFARLQKQKNELRNLLKLSFGLMWTLVIISAITCFFYRQELMNLLYIESDSYWGRVFGILILNFVWIGLIHVFGTYITASGRMREANIIFFITILLNVVLNLILIPDYGAWGAAIATLSTHGAVVLGLTYIIRRDVFSAVMLRVIMLAFVLTGIVVLLNAGVSLVPIHFWPIRFAIVILLSVFFAFTIGIIDLGQIRSAFMSSKEPS